MREPISLLDQVNTFNKSNRQHFILERTIRQRPPVYSSLNHTVDDENELKIRSLNVYTRKHLTTNRKTVLPYSERTRLDELLLPAIDRDLNHEENRHRRKRRRPFYRKSLFHNYSSTSTQIDLAQITARGLKPESQTSSHNLFDDDDDDDNNTKDNYDYHHVPPPSPSDNQIERLLSQFQHKNPSRSPSRQSSVDKEEAIPFRLPVLRRTPTNYSPHNVRSTLSNYLQRYY